MRHAPLLLAGVAFLLLAPQYWIALLTPATGIYHDDSIYLITARSLAQGHGYLIESLPAALPQTKYPVLFPALLSLVWRIAPDFPSNLLFLKLIPLLAALGWFYASFRLLLALSLPPLVATAAICLLAASPQVLFLSTAVLSETTFALLLTLCLWRAFTLPATPSQSQILTTAILAAAAFHTRTIGLALILGLGLHWALSRQWRTLLLFSIFSFSLCAPWPLWQWLHRYQTDPYLSAANYYSGYNVILNFSLPQKLKIIALNFLFITFSLQNIVGAAAAGFLGLLAFPFLLRSLFSSRLSTLIRLPLLTSACLILLWAWPPLRFLIPLLPLALAACYLGLPLRVRPWAPTLLCAAALVAGFQSANYSRAALSSGCWYPDSIPPQSWSAFAAQLQWIRANTQPGDILQSNVDPTIFLFTGRHAVRGSHRNAMLQAYLNHPEPLGSPREFESTLRHYRVRFLVETPWPWFAETPHFIRLRQQLPSQNLVPIDSLPSPGFQIFRTAFSPSNP
ncbi:MAG: hypothetical protein ACK5TN_22105 [Acidobacteriota bacterium]